ncbi:MAG: hypothetical protein ABIG42_11770 [bacterium]
MINKVSIIALLTVSLISELVFLSAADPAKDDILKAGKKLPSFTISEGDKKLTLPDDFGGKIFAVYFGNITDNDDGFEFLSWGGAFTIALRQSDEILEDVFFTGVASLKDRPLYWVPYLVKKTFCNEMKKNDVRGEMFYDFNGEIAEKFGIKQKEVRAIVVDRKGIIRKTYSQSVYDLNEDDLEELYDLFIELVQEEKDEG